jgi:hypothetical protein
MALSIPHKFSAGQSISAGKFNANFESVAAWSAEEDSAIASLTSDVAASVTALGNVGSGAFHASASGQVFTNAATTVILSDALIECFDSSSWFDNTTYKYTPLVAGYYIFNFSTAVTSGSVGSATLYIVKNTEALAVGRIANRYESMSGSLILHANGSTDCFYVQAVLDDGSGALTTAWSRFSGHLVKPD